MALAAVRGGHSRVGEQRLAKHRGDASGSRASAGGPSRDPSRRSWRLRTLHGILRSLVEGDGMETTPRAARLWRGVLARQPGGDPVSMPRGGRGKARPRDRRLPGSADARAARVGRRRRRPRHGGRPRSAARAARARRAASRAGARSRDEPRRAPAPLAPRRGDHRRRPQLLHPERGAAPDRREGARRRSSVADVPRRGLAPRPSRYVLCARAHPRGAPPTAGPRRCPRPMGARRRRPAAYPSSGRRRGRAGRATASAPRSRTSWTSARACAWRSFPRSSDSAFSGTRTRRGQTRLPRSSSRGTATRSSSGWRPTGWRIWRS